ncbi:MAG: XdhC family protein [Pseudomonadota bacterium]
MSIGSDAIPEQALAWHREGRGAALATVIRTWGSAPRPVGAQLAISGTAEIAGSVSGGCVEGAVVAEALEALEDGQPRILEYGVSDDEAFSVGLACGGVIRVMVEPLGKALGAELVEALTAARKAHRAVAYWVDTRTWERGVSDGATGALAREIKARFSSDRSGFEGDVFITVHNPPLKMIVVGAVHIAQHLVRMARMAGYAPTVVDPRETFGAQHRFQGETILNDWPDEALSTLALDHRTAVVTLTHDPKLDDPAILTALRSDVFYLGCLGSNRTHAKRLARLKEAGVTDDQAGRIHAPVGLDIGAASPAEIAISVMAQITRCLRCGA